MDRKNDNALKESLDKIKDGVDRMPSTRAVLGMGLATGLVLTAFTVATIGPRFCAFDQDDSINRRMCNAGMTLNLFK